MKEINKALAEWLGWEERQVYRGYSLWHEKGTNEIFGVGFVANGSDYEIPNWDPCNNISQIHKYLLPKVAEMGAGRRVFANGL